MYFSNDANVLISFSCYICDSEKKLIIFSQCYKLEYYKLSAKKYTEYKFLKYDKKCLALQVHLVFDVFYF